MNLSNALKFLFPAVVYVFLQSAGASPAFGPFAARVKELSRCENVQTEDLVRFDGRSTKVNKTSYFFTGNITFKVPINPDVDLHLDVARYGNGGWKENFMTLDLPDACESLKTYLPKVFEVFMRSMGNKTCPVQPGPFTIKLTEISKCEGVETTNEMRLDSWRLNKVNTTSYVYVGNVVLDLELTDEMNMQVDLAIWGNGGWREHYLTLDLESACKSAAKYMPVLAAELFKRANVTNCPVPKGTYPVASFPITGFKIGSKDIPSFQYGHYKGNIVLLSGYRKVGCLSFVFDIIPLKRKG